MALTFPPDSWSNVFSFNPQVSIVVLYSLTTQCEAKMLPLTMMTSRKGGREWATLEYQGLWYFTMMHRFVNTPMNNFLLTFFPTNFLVNNFQFLNS